MVKITLDIENYDKLSEIVTDLDLRIIEYNKMLDSINPNKLIPQIENKVDKVMRFGFSDIKKISTKEFSRNELRFINKKLNHGFFVESSKKDKKIGRPEKNKELKAGRPANNINKASWWLDIRNLGVYPQLSLILSLFRYKKECKLLIKDLYSLKDNNTDRENYIMFGIRNNDVVLFRFDDPIVNNALFIRFDKINQLFLKQEKITEYLNVLFIRIDEKIQLAKKTRKYLKQKKKNNYLTELMLNPKLRNSL